MQLYLIWLPMVSRKILKFIQIKNKDNFSTLTFILEDGVEIVLTENVGLDKYVGYYGVAVVKKDSSLKLKDLKDKKTCHTAAGKNAGWIIPVGYLLRTKTMPNLGNQWKSAAEYFGGSCVPGMVLNSVLGGFVFNLLVVFFS